MKTLQEIRDDACPKYTGETCSSTRLSAWIEGFDCAVKTLSEESAKLKAVISGQLSDNDDIGREFVYVNILRDENERLRNALEQIESRASDAGYNLTRIAKAALNPRDDGEKGK